MAPLAETSDKICYVTNYGDLVGIDSQRSLGYILSMHTLRSFDAQFSTDEACKTYLVKKRWPDGVRCPRCKAKEKVYALKTPFRWTCCNPDCGGRKGYRFSVTTRTIFQDTKIPLTLW